MVDSSAAFTGIVEVDARAVFIASFTSCKFRENALNCFVESRDSFGEFTVSGFWALDQIASQFSDSKAWVAIVVPESLLCDLLRTRTERNVPLYVHSGTRTIFDLPLHKTSHHFGRRCSNIED
jgi:hypothetical protein